MKNSKGFTIIEVVTVMSIVTVLFFTSLAIFRGRQSSVEFSQGAKEMEALIRYETSELTSGYYPGPRDIECTNDAVDPLNPSSARTLNFKTSLNGSKGSNKDCIYIGKVIHFTLNSSTFAIGVYSLADDVNQMPDPSPKVIRGTNVDTMKYATAPSDFYAVNSSGVRKSSMLGIIYSSFGQTSSNIGGISSVSLYKYLNVPYGQTEGRLKAEKFNNTIDATKIDNSEKFAYCFAREGSSDRYFIVYVSLSGNGIKTESSVVNNLTSISCA